MVLHCLMMETGFILADEQNGPQLIASAGGRYRYDSVNPKLGLEVLESFNFFSALNIDMKVMRIVLPHYFA